MKKWSSDNIQNREAGFEEIVESARILADECISGIAIVGIEKHQVYSNDRWAEVTGLGSGVPPNRDWINAFFGSEELNLGDDFIEYLEMGILDKEKEIMIGSNSGEVKWIQVHARKVKNESGIKIGYILIVNDITELKESERNCSVILDNSPNGIAIIQDGKVIFVNDKLIDISGMEKEELLTLSFDDLDDIVLPEHHEWIKSNLIKTINNGPFEDRLEFRCINGNGERIWMETVTRMIKYKGRDSLLVYYSDISERKEFEKKLMESERISRAYFEMAPVGMNFVTKDGIPFRINRSFEEIFGYSEEELKSMKFTDYTHKDDVESSNELVNEILDGKRKNFVMEKRYIHKEGKIIWAQVYVSGIFDEEGKLMFFVTMVDDITERKEAEEKLRLSEKRYRNLFERSNDALFIHDLQGRILKVNGKAADITGFSENELLKMKIPDLHPDDAMEEIERALRLIAERGSVKFETYINLKDGRRLPVQIRSGIIDDETNLVMGMVLDISERKQMEESFTKRFMKFVLDDGNCYYSDVYKRDTCREAFKDLVNVGYSGLIFNRSRHDDRDEKRLMNVRYYHISTMKGERNIEPDPELIKNMVLELKPRSAVLIERLDYLGLRNDPDKIIRFIQDLCDIAFVNRIIVLLSYDSRLSDGSTIQMVRKEANMILPRMPIQLIPERLEILKYIFKQNLMGHNPMHNEIHRELEISKPTVRKRLKELSDAGYVLIKKKGSSKLVELTELGKQILKD